MKHVKLKNPILIEAKEKSEFGYNEKMGKHLLEPTNETVYELIIDAIEHGHKAIYIYGNNAREQIHSALLYNGSKAHQIDNRFFVTL
jgi:hypothetical protein